MARGWLTHSVLQHGQLLATLAMCLGKASGSEGVWLELGAGSLAGWMALFTAMVGWSTEPYTS